MIKNIIFDVGRVLIDWFPHNTMKELGFSDDDIDAIDKILFKSGEWNEEDKSIRTPQEMEDYFAALSPAYEQKIRLFYKHAVDSAVMRDYTITLLDSLKAAGYNTYILSNFGQGAKEKLEAKGVFDFLTHADGYLFSYEIHQIKPGPEIYNALLKKYNLYSSECVFIDDVDINIDGARNVGIDGIIFKDIKQVLNSLENMGVIFDCSFIK